VDALEAALDPLPQVEAARASLAAATEKAALTGDPLEAVLEAMSLLLLAKLSLYRADAQRSNQLAELIRREAGSACLLAYDGRHVAWETELVSRLTTQLARATDRAVKARLWTIKFRTVSAVAATVVAMTLIAMGGGYALGFGSGRTDRLHTQNMLLAAALRTGATGTAMWSQLMNDNDVRAAMVGCENTTTRLSGRRACSLPVWLDPPMPPVVGASR
jgi:hypothetical protein